MTGYLVFSAALTWIHLSALWLPRFQPWLQPPRSRLRRSQREPHSQRQHRSEHRVTRSRCKVAPAVIIDNFSVRSPSCPQNGATFHTGRYLFNISFTSTSISELSGASFTLTSFDAAEGNYGQTGVWGVGSANPCRGPTFRGWSGDYLFLPGLCMLFTTHISRPANRCCTTHSTKAIHWTAIAIRSLLAPPEKCLPPPHVPGRPRLSQGNSTAFGDELTRTREQTIAARQERL